MASSLKERITDAMKEAMRAKDKERLATIRLIQAAFKQKEVDERIEITDQIALQILDKMIKQRRDSIEQFTAANRDDLVAKEQSEMTVIQEFMPEALSGDDVRKLTQQAIESTGAASPKDMGKVMGILKPQLQGRADMGEVSKLIKELLSG